MLQRRLACSVLIMSAVIAGITAATANADSEGDSETNIAQFKPVSSLRWYVIAGSSGVWFRSPLGVDCGIGDDGSFGCAGPLPGVPAGINEISWFPGDYAPRLRESAKPRFYSGHPGMILTGETYIAYQGSICAVTIDGGVYCARGDRENIHFLITSSSTTTSQ